MPAGNHNWLSQIVLTISLLQFLGLHVTSSLFYHSWWYSTCNTYQILFSMLHLWLISCFRTVFVKEKSVLNFKEHREFFFFKLSTQLPYCISRYHRSLCKVSSCISRSMCDWPLKLQIYISCWNKVPAQRNFINRHKQFSIQQSHF